MDGYIIIGTELDTSDFEAEINYIESQMQDIENKLKKADMGFEVGDTQKLEAQYAKLNRQLEKLVQKQRKLNSSDFSGLKNSIQQADNSTKKIITSVGKWALAVFGVRSAYNAVRSAASTLAQYNEQIGADIEYIRFALASALQPVIETIINLMYKLLSLVASIAKAWFGIDLFANASVSAFEKNNKALSKSVKSAKELNKQIAGFDEMNVIQETSTSSSSGGASGGTPSMDLSKIKLTESKIPKWMQWIKDNWLILVAALIGIAAAIALFSIKIKKGGKDIGSGTSFTGFFDSLGKAASSIALLGGLSLVISSITDLIDSFSESGLTLGEVAGLLGIVLGELTGVFIILMGAMTLLQPSWQSIAGAAVIFAGLSVVLLVVNELLKTLSETGMEVGDVGTFLASVVGSLVTLIGTLTLAAQLLQSPMAMAGVAVVVAGLSAILLVVAATLPTILEACSKFINDIGPFVIKLIEKISEGISTLIYALGVSLPPIIESVGNLFSKIFKGIEKIIKAVGDVIVNIMNTAKKLVSSVLNSILNFINKLGPAVNNFVDNMIKAVTKLINFMISGIEYMINTLIISSVRSFVNKINKLIPGESFDLKGPSNISISRFYPKLAVGGIVNMPGRGVPIGGAITGERGAEGVIPLTDSQAMETLGATIGRYITINANITNTMNGRVISRELQKINTNNDFARNS